MLHKDKAINLFVAILTPAAVGVVIWAFAGLSAEKLNAGVITISALTIFCSCYLRLQLPRVNIHLTISDGLVIMAMILYGGEVGVLLTVVETTLAAFNLRRQGVALNQTGEIEQWLY